MPRVHEKAVQWASLIFIGSADDVRLRLGHTQLASELASAAFGEPLLSAPPPETSVEDMTVPELKSKLVALGASDVGKKAELQCRLREARSSKEAGGGDDLETALGGPEGVDAVVALLDAATLRMLKTVSASCLFEVRRVLSDAASSWRKSPNWSAPKWVRKLTFKDANQIGWDRIKQLDGAVELPYLAPQLVQLLARSSVSVEALQAMRAMDVSVQAVHMTQIMAKVAQSIGPRTWPSIESALSYTDQMRKVDEAKELFSQMIELKLEPSVLAEVVLLVSTGTGADIGNWGSRGKEVKTLADQIMRSIMAQPAVLEPHIGALIEWCIDFESHVGRYRTYKDVATKINLLQQLPAAAFVEHAPKLVTLVCTCTGNYANLPDLSSKLCFDKLEPSVRAAAIGAALKQNMQEERFPEAEQFRLVSLLCGIGVDELLPLTDVIVALLDKTSTYRLIVVACELLCTLPDVAVVPHVPAMPALLMKLDEDIAGGTSVGEAGSSSPGITAQPEAWALRLVRAIASLSPALLYTHAGAFVEVRLHHPVTQVRIAAAEIVSRAAQSIDA